jgi:hypothetical protein
MTPTVLARKCLARAWADDTDDRSRRLLEQAAREIRRLMRRGLRVARARSAN